MKKLLLLIILALIPSQSLLWGDWVVKEYGYIPGFIGSTNTPDSYTATAVSGGGGFRCNFVASTSGYVNVIKAYLRYASGNFNGGIYTSDGLTKLGEGNLTNIVVSGDIATIPLDSPVYIESGTEYMLVLGCDGSDTYWQAGRKYVIYKSWYYSVPMTITDSMPSSISGGTLNNNYEAIIWCEYE